MYRSSKAEVMSIYFALEITIAIGLHYHWDENLN